MTTPGSPDPRWQQPGPAQQQPGQPQQPWGQQPQQQPWGQQPPYQQPPYQQPPQKSGSGKIIGIVAAVVAVVAIAVLAFVFLGSGGNPEAGDCVHSTAATELETVDCSDSDADYRVVGIDTEHDDYTSAQYYADSDTCTQFSDVTQQVWVGDTDDADATGTIYCLGAV